MSDTTPSLAGAEKPDFVACGISRSESAVWPLRVKEDNGKLYWYGPRGEVLAESDLSGCITSMSEYIYFNGQMIARRDPGSSSEYYYQADRMGSARQMVSVNMSGVFQSVVSESDFYPYAGERVISNTLTPANT